MGLQGRTASSALIVSAMCMHCADSSTERSEVRHITGSGPHCHARNRDCSILARSLRCSIFSDLLKGSTEESNLKHKKGLEPSPPCQEEGLQQLGALLALQHLDAAAHAAHEALLRVSRPRALLLRHAGQVRHVLVQGIAQRLDLQETHSYKQASTRCSAGLVDSLS